MPDTVLSLLLLANCLLMLIVWQASRILTRLKRLDAPVPKSSSVRKRSGSEGAAKETGAGGMFESFLQEDPSRGALTKREQSAAFRKWRKDKGLNWRGT